MVPGWEPNRLRARRDIWTIAASGGGERKLFDGMLSSEDPDYSSDGRRIVVTGYSYDHCSDVYCYPRKDIYALATDGSSVVQRLTSDPAHNDYRPALSPDGRTIVFESPIGLTLMNADGSARRLLSSRGGTGPQFSPDGTRIVYSLSSQLWTIGADGTGARKLPNRAVGAEYGPAWGVRR